MFMISKNIFYATLVVA